MTIEEHIKSTIIDVPDFPTSGIVYKDITPIFQNPILSERILNALEEIYRPMQLDGIAGLESRGFLFGMPLALRLQIPFILIRKKNKLPRTTFKVDYELEYGSSRIEMHTDAVSRGQRILIHDDLLATGGTARAAQQLIQMGGAEVVGYSFLIELAFLKGRQNLSLPSEQIITFATF